MRYLNYVAVLFVFIPFFRLVSNLELKYHDELLKISSNQENIKVIDHDNGTLQVTGDPTTIFLSCHSLVNRSQGVSWSYHGSELYSDTVRFSGKANGDIHDMSIDFTNERPPLVRVKCHLNGTDISRNVLIYTGANESPYINKNKETVRAIAINETMVVLPCLLKYPIDHAGNMTLELSKDDTIIKNLSYVPERGYILDLTRFKEPHFRSYKCRISNSTEDDFINIELNEADHGVMANYGFYWATTLGIIVFILLAIILLCIQRNMLSDFRFKKFLKRRVPVSKNSELSSDFENVKFRYTPGSDIDRNPRVYTEHEIDMIKKLNQLPLGEICCLEQLECYQTNFIQASGIQKTLKGCTHKSGKRRKELFLDADKVSFLNGPDMAVEWMKHFDPSKIIKDKWIRIDNTLNPLHCFNIAKTKEDLKEEQRKREKSILDECSHLPRTAKLDHGPFHVYNLSLEEEGQSESGRSAEGSNPAVSGYSSAELPERIILDDWIQIDETGTMKEGNFSLVEFGNLVKKGKFDRQIARKKPILPQRDKHAAFFNFLAEIKLHASLDSHPNIVTFIGATASKENLRNFNVAAIFEYCHEGDLDSYLKRHKYHFDDSDIGGSCHSTRPDFKLRTIHLIRLAKDVASGMEYLFSNGIVHRDLAARNILLSRCAVGVVSDIGADPGILVAKVGDLGLSRNLNGEECVELRYNEVLPYDIYPPSVNQSLMFYPEDDVWSIGLLYYRMFTLGDSLPNETFELRRPPYAPPKIWGIISKCLSYRSERPSFTQIKLDIQELEESFAITLEHMPPESFQSRNTIDAANSTHESVQIRNEITAPNPTHENIQIQNSTDAPISSQNRGYVAACAIPGTNSVVINLPV